MARKPREENVEVANVFDMISGVTETSKEFSKDNSNHVSLDTIIPKSNEPKFEVTDETTSEESFDSMIESSKETKNNRKAKGRKGRSKTVIYDGVEYRSATFLLREDIHKALKHYGVDNGVPDYQTVNKAIAKFLGIKY